MIQFRLGGQVAANIEAQNQMLFDAMTPEQQLKVLKAQAERAAAETAQYAADAERGAKMVIYFGVVIGLVGVFGQVGLLFVIGAVFVVGGLFKLQNSSVVRNQNL